MRASMFTTTWITVLLGLGLGSTSFSTAGLAEQVPVVEGVEVEDSPAADAARHNAAADVPAAEAMPPDTGPPPAEEPPPVEQPPVEP